MRSARRQAPAEEGHAGRMGCFLRAGRLSSHAHRTMCRLWRLMQLLLCSNLSSVGIRQVALTGRI